MAKTVVGLMDNAGEAESVVRALTGECGCERSDIGLMARGAQEGTSAQTDADKGGNVAGGALKGAGTGAAIGGVLGLVAGVASLSIPGFGPFIAAGPIASALAGMGIGAAAGGIIGALTNLGVPEDEAHYYAEGVRRGGTLVTVHAGTDERAECAAQVMRRHGAVDIEQRASEWKKQGWAGRITGEEQVLPVVEEELVVGKRAASEGKVRVYSRVTETPVQETVQLREEHASIERRPVNRPVGAADDAFQERSIEVSEMAEEPVVAKRARVVEEVRVGKEASTREQTVRGKVKKTDVKVERGAGRYTGPERRKAGGAAYNGAERRVVT